MGDLIRKILSFSSRNFLRLLDNFLTLEFKLPTNCLASRLPRDLDLDFFDLDFERFFIFLIPKKNYILFSLWLGKKNE